MIAMYFDSTYRSFIRKFFKKYDSKHFSFIASYHTVYFVINNRVYCEVESTFKRRYPETEIIDPKEIYEEY